MRLARSTSLGVSNPLLKHKKPQYSLGKTDLRRYPICPEGLFSQFSLTHPFKHSNEAFKATFGAQKTHVFIGSVLTRSSVVTQCRTACNVELLAMSNYLQCLLAMSNCLQCRTSCNVELLAVCACNVELLAMSNYLQCRTACNVELLAMLN